MKDPVIITLLVLSGTASAWLIYRLLSGGRSVLEKTTYCLVLLVPFVGPLLYVFLVEEVPPQSPWLRNAGPRGAYTDRMISINAALDENARQEAILLEEEIAKNEDQAEPKP